MKTIRLDLKHMHLFFVELEVSSDFNCKDNLSPFISKTRLKKYSLKTAFKS